MLELFIICLQHLPVVEMLEARLARKWKPDALRVCVIGTLRNIV